MTGSASMAAVAGGHRFLALGDSYTIGEGVEPDERWPAQLARRLQSRGIAIDEPMIVAQTGWTTDELGAAMDAARFDPPYALVTLLIGVNNQYRGRSADDYRQEFATLLARAIELGGGRANRVVVVSIPDWGVTGFAREQTRDAAQIAREIDAFNAAATGIVRSRGAAFVDITGRSREAGDDAAMLVGDRLHPSVAQYALWTQAILHPAAAALTGSPGAD
jgi:lysophospholipase L1-like esterase